jgi:acetyl-CoA synthetase
VNFARDVLDRMPAERLALVELARAGTRREWSFGEVSERSARLAGTLARRGIGRGDVVMTLIGNRPEWVFTMIACFRIGAVVLPCTEQLRAKDLRLRIETAHPALIVADERNRAELEAALAGPDTPHAGPDTPHAGPDTPHAGPDTPHAGPDTPHAGPDTPHAGPDTPHAGPGTPHAGPDTAHASIDANAIPVLLVPDDALFAAEPLPALELAPEEPCLITFTSGTAGEPKAVVHAQRYLDGQRLQADHWLGAKAGELVWCTAASGWSKSARNVFIAPWLSGASALLHDARFDPAERLELLAKERVNLLCMAPTEYRVIAKRATLTPLQGLRGMVAAGEALNPEVLHAWREATGLEIRDGYGQTETGQLTGMPLGEPARPGSMGLALPGVELRVLADLGSVGELTADPATIPTFFLGYLGEGVRRQEDGSWRVEDRRFDPAHQPWRTGDRVGEDGDGYLWFEGRADDVIVSAGYRIGPFEVESALVAHPAVAEAAAVASPDEERGAIVRAVVVLRDGHAPSPALAKELQEHVKRETAPYKYPRIVDFARELPKTASGKVRRAALRAEV